MSDLASRLDLAHNKLAIREPFIAAVMTRVKREVTDRVPTAATNGTTCMYNPKFCDPLTDEELFGLVLHESLHVVLMHMWRRGDRDPSLWNYANDAIINAFILARRYSLPSGGVVLKWVRETHDSETVYEKLKQDPPPPQSGGSGTGDGEGDDEGTPNAGGFDGTGDIHDAIDDATRVDMEATILAAAKMAKDCGQGSSLIDRILGKDSTPVVRWQDVCRAMMTEATAADYTYMRPSRRFIGSGLYLPSLRVESLGGLAVGFDTSGSMGQRECDQIAAELRAIVDDLRPAFVEVIYCDSKVKHVERFEIDEPLELHPKGGGGTRFKPVFDHVEETGEHYCGLIYFTDMIGYLRECIEPSMPVIWADIGRSHPAAPFGTLVPVNI